MTWLDFAQDGVTVMFGIIAIVAGGMVGTLARTLAEDDSDVGGARVLAIGAVVLVVVGAVAIAIPVLR